MVKVNNIGQNDKARCIRKSEIIANVQHKSDSRNESQDNHCTRDAYRQAIHAVLTHLRFDASSALLLLLSSLRRFLGRPFATGLLCGVEVAAETEAGLVWRGTSVLSACWCCC